MTFKKTCIGPGAFDFCVFDFQGCEVTGLTEEEAGLLADKLNSMGISGKGQIDWENIFAITFPNRNK